MYYQSVHYTLNIFQHLINDTPPLVSKEIQADMRQALEQMKDNYDLTLEALEDTVIVFGKRIWPYRKAFEEFLDIYEARLGENFLQSKLSLELKKRYQEFKAHGGELRDLHSGRPAEFFTPAERTRLCVALIEMNATVRGHAAQAVLTTDRKKYEQRVVEFQVILDDIEKRLGTLRQMADDEQEHPELAAEIRAQVNSFEYGLCLLGPPHTYEAVCAAPAHFVGRKKDKAARASISLSPSPRSVPPV